MNGKQEMKTIIEQTVCTLPMIEYILYLFVSISITIIHIKLEQLMPLVCVCAQRNDVFRFFFSLSFFSFNYFEMVERPADDYIVLSFSMHFLWFHLWPNVERNSRYFSYFIFHQIRTDDQNG